MLFYHTQIYFYMTRRMRFLPENLDTYQATWIQLMILVNGADCSSPGPMWLPEFVNLRLTTYDEPLLITGVCSGLPAGPVDISIGAKHYGFSPDVRVLIGAFVQPHLLVEEIFDAYLDI